MSEELPPRDEEGPGPGEPEAREGAFAALLSPLRDFAGRSRSHAADYLRARADLLGIEAEEAAAVSKSLAAGGILGAVLLVPGYTLCLVALLLGCAGEWETSRFGLLALVAGIVHLVLGTAILLRTRRLALATRFFEESREQLKRDQEWLKHLSESPKSPTSAPGNPD